MSDSMFHSRSSNEENPLLPRYSNNMNEDYRSRENYRGRNSGRGRSLNLERHNANVNRGDNNNVEANGKSISNFEEDGGNTNNLDIVEGSYYEWRKIVSDCSVSCGKGLSFVGLDDLISI